jgi:hypothetical protein
MPMPPIAKERARLAKVGFPEMTFTSMEYDFGTVNEGDKVSGSFEYTNTGKSDLIITSAKASCGCTVPEYDKDKAIKPGEKGSLKFVFDTHGKPEKQNKSITITVQYQKSTRSCKYQGLCKPKIGKYLYKSKTQTMKKDPNSMDMGHVT